MNEYHTKNKNWKKFELPEFISNVVFTKIANLILGDYEGNIYIQDLDSNSWKLSLSINEISKTNYFDNYVKLKNFGNYIIVTNQYEKSIGVDKIEE